MRKNAIKKNTKSKRKGSIRYQKGGNCIKPVGDCLNKPIQQLGSIPNNPSPSELAFYSRECCGPNQAGSKYPINNLVPYKHGLVQNGGGYYFGYNDCTIGGQPKVISYDNMCPPVFVGELLMRGGDSKKKANKKIYKINKAHKTNKARLTGIGNKKKVSLYNKSKKQAGGVQGSCMLNSPTVCSDFNPSMNQRLFNCTQPCWNERCI